MKNESAADVRCNAAAERPLARSPQADEPHDGIRLYRLLAEQSSLLEFVARGASLADCSVAITAAIARLRPGARAAVLVANHDRRTFERAYSDTLPDRFLANVEGAPIGDDAIGACGTTVFNAEPVTCTDIASDDRWAPEWRNLCKEQELFACHSQPVPGPGGEAVASLVIFFDRSHRPDDWELEIAQTAAHAVSIAIQRERSATARRDTEDRYRRLFELSQDAIFLLDPDRNVILDVNPAGVTMFGYDSREELLATPLSEFHPKDLEQFVEFVHSVHAEGTGWTNEFACRAKNGQFLTSEISASSIIMDGRLCLLAAVRDASERKRAQEVLRKSEERFRALVNASSDVVYRMSPDWTEMRQLDGRGFIADTPAPQIKWIDEYIFDEDQPRVWARIEEAILTRSTFELEHRVRRVDGSVGWTFSRAIPVIDEEGEIVEWFGMAADVTERVQAVEEREHQRRLYEAILDNTPDFAYIFDLDHRFIYANANLLKMWGKSWDEAIGKNCHELGYEPWHAEMHDRELEQVIAAKQPVRGEVPFTGTFGRRSYDYIFTPVLDAEGDVIAVAGTTRDVTDYRDAEDRQVLMVNELNHRVKNTLAVVQALAQQTFKRADVPASLQSAFEGRLEALAGAHNVLTREHWRSAELADIVHSAIAGCSGQSNQITTAGPAVRLDPKRSVTLSMAFHELCTNAIKYGALSAEKGTVALSWSVHQDRLHVRWEEHGGPAVRPPERRGFGSRMLERALAAELEGHVKLDFRNQGLVCEIDAPLLPQHEYDSASVAR